MRSSVQGNVLAVDPGRNTGWALFINGWLRRCGLTHPPSFEELPQDVDVLVIEIPHTGAGRASKKDLVTLAMRAGLVIGRYPHAVHMPIMPNVWKGSTPKLIANKRTLTALSLAERALVPLGAKHDTLDAIGIGLWYCRAYGYRQ
jgi:hypothetical protein